MKKSNKLQLIILSGISGSGKSTALNILEDIGYFAIDNLPAPLLLPLLQLMKKDSSKAMQKVAIVMDARDPSFFKDYKNHLKKLSLEKIPYKIILFDARDDVLRRRYSETRRKHPLVPQGRIDTGLERERELLHPFRTHAHQIIDTTNVTIHELKEKIRTSLEHPSKDSLVVNLISFGYRYGLPLESDLVFDVRFLPNPFFVPHLKNLTGTNPLVSRFVLSKEETKKWIPKLEKFLLPLLSQYAREGKSYVTVALGCTGGKHRSVALVERFFKILKNEGYIVNRTHRDIIKG